MIQLKNKPSMGFRLPFSTDPLHFELACPYPLSECVARMNKLDATQLSTEIVFVRVDNDVQRFNLKSRDYRVHLLEAVGYVKRIDDNNTQIKGDVFSQSVAALLFGIMVVVIAAVAIALANLLIIIVGLLAICLVALYCRQLVQLAHHEQRELVRHFETILAPPPTT